MLKLNIKGLLAARGISEPHSWLVNIGISPKVATKLLNGTQINVSRKHMAAICRYAHCTVDNLFYWVPPDDMVDAASHPLHSLRNPVIPNVMVHVAELPISKLVELEKTVMELKKKQ